MANYSASIKSAAKTIKEKGLPIVFVRVTESEDYDPVNGGYIKEEKKFDIYGVRSTASIAEVQGSGFEAGAITLLIAADVVTEVDTTDYVIIGVHKWGIEKVLPVAPAEQAIIFTLQIADEGEYV